MKFETKFSKPPLDDEVDYEYAERIRTGLGTVCTPTQTISRNWKYEVEPLIGATKEYEWLKGLYALVLFNNNDVAILKFTRDRDRAFWLEEILRRTGGEPLFKDIYFNCDHDGKKAVQRMKNL